MVRLYLHYSLYEGLRQCILNVVDDLELGLVNSELVIQIEFHEIVPFGGGGYLIGYITFFLQPTPKAVALATF